MSKPIVSVIVPIYNAEKYIERCAVSLFEQTYENIEYIFIDDCTPDSSIEVLRSVLNRYPRRKETAIIKKTERNSKQAYVRSLGLSVASGDYIIHCDPDDWMEPNHISSMIELAISGNYDIVTSNYITENADGSANIIEPRVYEMPIDILKSSCFYFLSLWSHLVRASIIRDNKVGFFPGINYMEDFGFLARVCYYAKSINFTRKATYHYNKANDNSITKRQESEEIMSMRIHCLKLLDDFYYDKNINPYTLNLLMRAKRDIRDIYLRSGDMRKWKALFPEVGKWEFKHSDAKFLYRLLYYWSSRYNYNLISVYRKLAMHGL